VKKVFVSAVVGSLLLAGVVGCGGGKKDSGPEAACEKQVKGMVTAFMNTKSVADVFTVALVYGGGDDSSSDDDLGKELPACKPLSKSQQKEITDSLKPEIAKLKKHFEDIGVPPDGN
jgi:hypothetical protein